MSEFFRTFAAKFGCLMQKSTKYKVNIVIGAVIALVYVLLPIDISPDAVPLVGWIDDIIAVLLAIANGLLFASKLRNLKNRP